jgi:hypothetical protein
VFLITNAFIHTAVCCTSAVHYRIAARTANAQTQGVRIFGETRIKCAAVRTVTQYSITGKQHNYGGICWLYLQDWLETPMPVYYTVRRHSLED